MLPKQPDYPNPNSPQSKSTRVGVPKRAPHIRLPTRTLAGMTRTLHIMRHAKSDWSTGEPDHERPLNARGRRDAVAAGEYLVSLGAPIDRVLSSSSTRTRQTWARVEQQGIVTNEVEFLDAIYEASTASALRLLREVPEVTQSALWLGHFPTVEDLVVTLGIPDGNPAWQHIAHKYPTSAIATLSFDGDWRDLAPESCTLIDFAIPRG